MPWKWPVGRDRVVEVIVERRFDGALISIARVHPVWIVESDFNKPRIDMAREHIRAEDLFEISSFVPSGLGLEQEVIDVMPNVYTHYNWSSPRYEWIWVRGTGLTDEIRAEMEEYGFTVDVSRSDGFVLKVHPDRDFNVMDYSDLPPSPPR